MKFFIAICLFFALASAEFVAKKPEDEQQYHEECVEEQKIPEFILEQYREDIYPNNAFTQCYLKCMYTKLAVFNDNGFDLDVIKQQVASHPNPSFDAENNDELHAQIQSCIDKNEQKLNNCEWAYNVGSCFVKNNIFMVQSNKVAYVSSSSSAPYSSTSTTAAPSDV